MKGKTKGKELETKRRKGNNLEDRFSFLLSYFFFISFQQPTNRNFRKKKTKENK